jgi:flagellar hook-associated protein 2
MLAVSPSLSSSVNRLSALGIKLDEHGVLQINQATLSNVLNDGVSGVSFGDVKKLFALRGQSSSPGIEFITGSRFTKSSTTPYQVDITQAAEQATLTANNDLASSITLDSSNNQLAVSVNGKSSTVTLAEGTYTPLTLAHEVQSEINSALSSLGGSMTATLSGQKLSLTTERYGSASSLSIDSGSALSILGFAGGETDHGQDVAGQFMVNGVAEAATGLGQILTGSSSNANTADLAIQVSLTNSQLQFGVDATLDVSQGLASQLSNVLDGLLDPTAGRLKTITDRFSKNVDDAQKAITKAQNEITTQTASLQHQFASMEQTISQLQAQSQFVLNSLGTSSTSSSTSSTGSRLSVAG